MLKKNNELKKYRKERARKNTTVTLDAGLYEGIEFNVGLMDDMINELVNEIVNGEKPNVALIGQMQFLSKRLVHQVKRES